MIKNQKGQTSIEALLAVPLIISFIFMVLVVFTSAGSFIYAQYQLHEAIVCLQDQSRVACTNQIKTNMKQNLTFWKMNDLKLRRETTYDSGQIIPTFNFIKKISLKIEKRVRNEH